jgi:hypothetical protein
MTFFDSYSYRKKNYALAIVTVLLVAASYKRVFKNTVETVAYKKELQSQLQQSANAIDEIKETQRLLLHMNRLLGKENLTVEKVQQGFLNFFAKYARGILVYQVDEVLAFQHPDFTIYTHRILLKGNFLETLRFMYLLEKNFDLAKLINVQFDYKKYNSEEKEAVYTTLLIQNYTGKKANPLHS